MNAVRNEALGASKLYVINQSEFMYIDAGFNVDQIKWKFYSIRKTIWFPPSIQLNSILCLLLIQHFNVINCQYQYLQANKPNGCK